MDGLKECLKHLKLTVSDEVSNVKKLEGEALQKMTEHFYFDEEIRIYYNEYNLIFTRESDFQQVAPFLKQSDLVMQLELPKSNVYLSIYQYFNSQLLEEYIPD